jgi:hypothetical protein
MSLSGGSCAAGAGCELCYTTTPTVVGSRIVGFVRGGESEVQSLLR